MEICFLARDKFSTLPSTLKFLFARDELLSKCCITILDNGYPAEILKQCEKLCDSKRANYRILKFPEFANTNYIINKFLEHHANNDYFVFQENDCLIGLPDLFKILDAMQETGIEIASPCILNPDFSTHFRPINSWISIEPDRSSFFLDRGRSDSYFVDPLIGTLKKEDILERHCLIVERKSLGKLGKLDEEMHDRTDIDLSMQMKSTGVQAGVHFGVSAMFINSPNLRWDREYLSFRWDIEKVAASHARLLKKWEISGYKRTINHAYDIRACFLGEIAVKKDCDGRPIP